MPKTNLQVRITPEMSAKIDKIAPGSKSEFVREAIEEKIQRELFKKMEAQWIEALIKNPQDTKYDEDWLKAESWGPK